MTDFKVGAESGEGASGGRVGDHGASLVKHEFTGYTTRQYFSGVTRTSCPMDQRAKAGHTSARLPRFLRGRHASTSVRRATSQRPPLRGNGEARRLATSAI